MKPPKQYRYEYNVLCISHSIQAVSWNRNIPLTVITIFGNHNNIIKHPLGGGWIFDPLKTLEQVKDGFNYNIYRTQNQQSQRDYKILSLRATYCFLFHINHINIEYNCSIICIPNTVTLHVHPLNPKIKRKCGIREPGFNERTKW